MLPQHHSMQPSSHGHVLATAAATTTANSSVLNVSSSRFVFFFATAGGNLSVLLYYQTGIHRQFKIRNQLRKRSSLDRILTFKLGSRTGSRSGRIAPVNEFKEGEEGETGSAKSALSPRGPSASLAVMWDMRDGLVAAGSTAGARGSTGPVTG